MPAPEASGATQAAVTKEKAEIEAGRKLASAINDLTMKWVDVSKVWTDAEKKGFMAASDALEGYPFPKPMPEYIAELMLWRDKIKSEAKRMEESQAMDINMHLRALCEGLKNETPEDDDIPGKSAARKMMRLLDPILDEAVKFGKRMTPTKFRNNNLVTLPMDVNIDVLGTTISYEGVVIEVPKEIRLPGSEAASELEKSLFLAVKEYGDLAKAGEATPENRRETIRMLSKKWEVPPEDLDAELKLPEPRRHHIRVWEPDPGEEFSVPEGHRIYVWSVWISEQPGLKMDQDIAIRAAHRIATELKAKKDISIVLTDPPILKKDPLTKVPTYRLAGMFTSPLAPEELRALVESIGIRSILPKSVR